MASAAGAARKAGMAVYQGMLDEIKHMKGQNAPIVEIEKLERASVRKYKETLEAFKDSSLDEQLPLPKGVVGDHSPTVAIHDELSPKSFKTIKPSLSSEGFEGVVEGAKYTPDYGAIPTNLNVPKDLAMFAGADAAIAGVRGKSPRSSFSEWEAPIEGGMSRKDGAVLGLGLGGGAIAASYSPQEEANMSLAAQTPTEEEKAKLPEAAAAPADGGAGAMAGGIGGISVPEATDYLKAIGAPPKEEDFADWNSRLGNVGKDRQTAADEMKGDVARAQAAADVSASSLERRELIETISNAVGQMVLGMHGLKTGLDVSGAKFNKTDWNAKLTNVRQKLKDDLAVLSEAQQLDQAVITERKDALMQEKDGMLRKNENAFRQYEAKIKLATLKQGADFDNRKLTVEVDKANMENKRLLEAADAKAKAEGKDPTERLSSVIKTNGDEVEKTAAAFYALAKAIGAKEGKENTDESRAAQVQEAGRLNVKYAALTGVPLDHKDGDPLTPRDYSKMGADDINGALVRSNNSRNAILEMADRQGKKVGGEIRELFADEATIKDDTAKAYLALGYTPVTAIAKANMEFSNILRKRLYPATEVKK